MCGIAGIINPTGIEPGILTKISSIIKHRGPDDEGFMVIDECNETHLLKGKHSIPEFDHLPSAEALSGVVKLAFVHRRLSVNKGGAVGHQPLMQSETGLSIVYNGVIYNNAELRQELETLGYKFENGNDAEVILNSYLYWSDLCVNHIVGMWAFAIFDQNKKILFCSRDRFGIKPFYYYEKPELFVFASEIKVILSLPGINAALDEENSIEFLVNSNMNFHGKTFFRGINELQQGHNLIYDLGKQRLSVYRYYQLPISGIHDFISPHEALERFNELIDSSLNCHLSSDFPVGTSLSGGLDSCTILTRMLNKNLPYRVNTFTAAFPGNNADETTYIQALRKRYDFSDYYTYPDINKVLSEAELFFWHQEQPVQNTSMFAHWEVIKLANQHSVKVLVNGQGMDEILGGYSEFVGSFLFGKLTGGHIIEFINEYSKLKNNYKTSSINNELFRTLFYYLPSALRNNIYSRKRIGPSIISKDYNYVLKRIRFEKRISNSMSETSVMSINNILPALLRYDDRNSMAFSIESRMPFLDHRLVEFCVNLPDNLKIYSGWTKYILRKSSEPYLPPEITWRKDKFGFVTPEKIWTDNFKKHIHDFMMGSNMPAIIDKNKMAEILTCEEDNSIKIGEIWKLLLFVKWFNTFCAG